MERDVHEAHHPARFRVLREHEIMLEEARRRLSEAHLRLLEKEMDAALELPDDEATLVLADIKERWSI